MRPIALVVLLPLAAFAQSSTPEPSAAPAVAPPAATARPDWSLGAGVGFETGLFASSPTYVLSSSSGLYLSSPSIPSAIASLERRLSARDWLVLGASGSYMHDRQDLRPQTTGVTKSDRSGLAVSVGVRHVVTPAGAPVAVSFDALANLGATRWEGDVSYYDYAAGGAIAAASFDQSGWRAGATFGLAVERELTGAVSLRVATPLVGASYWKTRTKVSGQPTQDGEELGAGLVLSPSLELRLAF